MMMIKVIYFLLLLLLYSYFDLQRRECLSGGMEILNWLRRVVVVASGGEIRSLNFHIFIAPLLSHRIFFPSTDRGFDKSREPVACSIPTKLMPFRSPFSLPQLLVMKSIPESNPMKGARYQHNRIILSATRHRQEHKRKIRSCLANTVCKRLE